MDRSPQYFITEEMANFLSLDSGEKYTKWKITKHICEYINKYHLYHDLNKRIILCDEKLRNLLSVPINKRLSYFNLQRYLKPYFIILGGIKVRWSKTNRKNSDLRTEKYIGDECVCSLCLGEINEGSDIHRLPCNHVFHAHNCVGDKSIKNWINKNGTCPYCRTEINTSKIQPNLDEVD